MEKDRLLAFSDGLIAVSVSFVVHSKQCEQIPSCYPFQIIADLDQIDPRPARDFNFHA